MDSSTHENVLNLIVLKAKTTIDGETYEKCLKTSEDVIIKSCIFRLAECKDGFIQVSAHVSVNIIESGFCANKSKIGLNLGSINFCALSSTYFYNIITPIKQKSAKNQCVWSYGSVYGGGAEKEYSLDIAKSAYTISNFNITGVKISAKNLFFQDQYTLETKFYFCTIVENEAKNSLLSVDSETEVTLDRINFFKNTVNDILSSLMIISQKIKMSHCILNENEAAQIFGFATYLQGTITDCFQVDQSLGGKWDSVTGEIKQEDQRTTVPQTEIWWDGGNVLPTPIDGQPVKATATFSFDLYKTTIEFRYTVFIAGIYVVPFMPLKRHS